MIVWIEKTLALAIHERQLAEHGGGTGVRDEALLDSALARPQHLLAYGEPDAAALAATYGWGLARNHPFADGNKRSGAFLFVDFLARNGRLIRNGEPVINDVGLAALALLVAESAPSSKEVMIRLIENMLALPG